MIDFHSHILPGIDDGADNIDESIAMAAALQKAGFKTIYCTPHLIKGCFDADNQTVLNAVAELQTRLKEENIPIELLPGREYYLDEFLDNYLEQPIPLGGTQYILMEIPNNTPGEYVKESCFKIKRGGFIPMIAHPERCILFAADTKPSKSRLWLSGAGNKDADIQHPLIDYLKDIDCAFQGNLGSFDGWYGQEVQQTANELKKMGIYTHYGTDVHSMRGVNRLPTKLLPLLVGETERA